LYNGVHRIPSFRGHLPVYVSDTHAAVLAAAAGSMPSTRPVYVHNFLLLRALQMIVQVGGPWVRSITVTGHSLGGALASICGFDLATKITWSSGTNSEVEFPNDPDLVRLHDSNNAAPTCVPPDNLRSAALATHMHTRPCNRLAANFVYGEPFTVTACMPWHRSVAMRQVLHMC
jgi:hypothetical protein